MKIPIGAGLQGYSNIEYLDKFFDVYLVLESDIGMCEGLGNRAWLRILNNGKRWRNPVAWADYCVNTMAKVYPYGTRVLIPQNEANLALEGGGESEQDYIFLGNWWEVFLIHIRVRLSLAGMSDVKIAGPALSPGHQETDGGGYNKHLLPCYDGVDIIAAHYYWYQGGGFLNDADAIHYSRRIEQDKAYIKSLGIPDKPWAVTEYNRPVNIFHQPDIDNYRYQVQDYVLYLAKMGVTSFIFLATNTDSAFDKLSLSHMGDIVEGLAEWKRQLPEDALEPDVEVKPVKKLTEQYPVHFEAWKESAGIENAFRAHLLGIGALPLNSEALMFLNNQHNSATSQLSNGINTYPFDK